MKCEMFFVDSMKWSYWKCSNQSNLKMTISSNYFNLDRIHQLEIIVIIVKLFNNWFAPIRIFIRLMIPWPIHHFCDQISVWFGLKYNLCVTIILSLSSEIEYIEFCNFLYLILFCLLYLAGNFWGFYLNIFKKSNIWSIIVFRRSIPLLFYLYSYRHSILLYYLSCVHIFVTTNLFN